MDKNKTLVNKNQGMRKAGILAVVLLLTISLGASLNREVVDFNNLEPSQNGTYQITEEGGDVYVTGDVFTDTNGELQVYFWANRQNFSYYDSNDTWIDETTGSQVLYDTILDPVKNISSDQWDNFEIQMDSDNAGTLAYPPEEQEYTAHLVVEQDNGNVEFLELHFDVEKVEGVDGVETPENIVDGGAIDQAILTTSDFLGIGLNLTRMSMSFFLSLAVGLAIGWKEEYSSGSFAYLGFLGTFATLILIGLAPVIEGVVLFTLIVIASWVIYKND